MTTETPETATIDTTQPISEARLRANRLNAQNSSGPKTDEGKKRSSLNATRHGLLAQTLHLPEEEMAAYHEFTAAYVKDLNPVGVVEAQLAHSCADLQFRLNRIAAAEHNLFPSVTPNMEMPGKLATPNPTPPSPSPKPCASRPTRLNFCRFTNSASRAASIKP